MAKKFVRGITDIKEINKQDFDTNNVNDLLSDGVHNYIHRKKEDNSEEYHNLTNNLKTITSDNTDLLSVTNDNNSTNSATVHPKHDAQKEQTIESTRNTITIEHGENATSETTKVDTNPAYVLEHNNLLTNYGLKKVKNGNNLELSIEYTRVQDGFDLNTLTNGRIRAGRFENAPRGYTWFFVSSYSEGSYVIQEAMSLDYENNKTYRRLKTPNGWGAWREQVTEKSTVDTLLSQKQNTLTSNNSIGIDGSGLKQVYYGRTEYTLNNAYLQTYYRSVAPNTNPTLGEEESNFIVKLDKNVASATFNLNTRDTGKFRLIINKYGTDNSVRISGCVFTLNESNLTVSTTNNTQQNYVITFSDII